MRDIILAFFGSLCAGVLFNVKKSNLFWTGLSGVFGEIAFIWFYSITGEIILPSFAGAVAVGLYSESAARVLKSPSTVFSISGIFPLVPGVAAYNTIQLIVEDHLAEAGNKAFETIASAGAIAFGIMMITAVFRFVTKLKEQYLRKRNLKKQ